MALRRVVAAVSRHPLAATVADCIAPRVAAAAGRSFAATATDRARVAICGAGVSGLTLAGILSTSDRFRVTIFERAHATRDQGYGLDLDKNGQEALVRAGLYDRYWDISYPWSDCTALFGLGGTEPLGVLFTPRLLMRYFPDKCGSQPETNRGALRDALLEALATRGNCEVNYERGAFDVKEVGGDGASRAELFDRDGASLGTYDLVIDAMGLHSTLRQYRVHDPIGKHYANEVMIHGVITDVEKSCPSFAKRFDRFGTVCALGRGYQVVAQRFGGGAGDKRAVVFYAPVGFDVLDGEAGVLEQMGIERPTSRSSGIMDDEERLDKAKAWILSDMGGHLDEVWQDAVRALERVTVRGNYMHGDDTTLRDGLTLPLVCIGDAPRNCGLGGGGNLALQDANELATLLEADDAFDETGAANLEPLRAAEAVMFERKSAFHEERTARMAATTHLVTNVGRGPYEWNDVRDGYSPFGKGFPAWVPFPLVKFALARLGALSKAWYAWDRKRGGGGTAPGSAPLYANVTKLLAAKK
mmetsp:Transcript_29942/g.89627  ORF Transcript_29942/g.89627 Transcript_29942/m.89627 type:complete len:529 (+) Transcript_29942:79-1665(+)